jgi:hypothetical protein
MILVIIRMKALSEKRMELSQTIASLSGSIRGRKDAGAATFAKAWSMKMNSFFLRNGIPRRTLGVT